MLWFYFFGGQHSPSFPRKNHFQWMPGMELFTWQLSLMAPQLLTTTSPRQSNNKICAKFTTLVKPNFAGSGLKKHGLFRRFAIVSVGYFCWDVFYVNPAIVSTFTLVKTAINHCCLPILPTYDSQVFHVANKASQSGMYSSSNDETNIAGLLKNGPGLSRCISYWTAGIFQPAMLVYQSVDFFELVQSSMTATQNLIRDDASMFQHFVREVVGISLQRNSKKNIYIYVCIIQYILTTCFLFNTLSITRITNTHTYTCILKST